MPSPSSAAATTKAAWRSSASAGASNPSTVWHCELPPSRRSFTPPCQPGAATSLALPAGMPPKASSTARKKASASMSPAAATTQLAAVYWLRT